MEKMIFVDSNDTEYIGTVLEYGDEHVQNTLLHIRPCPLDSTIAVQYHFQPDFKRLIVRFEDLGIWMSIHISTSVSNDCYEELKVADLFHLYIGLISEGGPANSYMTIAVNERNHPNPYESYSNFEEMYEIRNEYYNDVFINSIEGEEDYGMVYNQQVGIIRIHSDIDPKLDLVLDRIE